MDAADLARRVFGAAYDRCLARIPQGGKPAKDFLVEGVRFNDLHEQVFSAAYWQARSLHQSYEWTLGDESWGDVDTST